MNQLQPRERFAAATVLALGALVMSFDFASVSMTGDGVLYGNIAAMLAEGHGSFWRLPFFNVDVEAFYDQPPLGIYLQSLLIELIGHRHAAIRLHILLVTVAFLGAFWLLVRARPLGETDEEAGVRAYWWPVFVLLAMPPTLRVLEGNYLDGLLATTSMMAVWFGLRAVRGSVIGPAIAVAVLVYVGLLIKGPTALFPLVALPCVLYVARGSIPVALAFGLTATAVVAVLCIATWLADAEARTWLHHYWMQQLKASIFGERNVEYGRGYALWRMVRNVCAGVVVALVLALVTGQRRVRWRPETTAWAIIGLSASIPLLLSSRNYGHYLMSATPYFALAITSAVAPMRLPGARTLGLVAIGVWGLVLAVVFANWGAPGDDERKLTMIRDMAALTAADDAIVYCQDWPESFGQEVAYLYRDHGRKYRELSGSIVTGARFWLACNHQPEEVIKLDREIPMALRERFHYVERL